MEGNRHSRWKSRCEYSFLTWYPHRHKVERRYRLHPHFHHFLSTYCRFTSHTVFATAFKKFWIWEFPVSCKCTHVVFVLLLRWKPQVPSSADNTFFKDITKHNDYYRIVWIDLPPSLYLTVSRHSLSLNLKVTSSARLAAFQGLCNYRCALQHDSILSRAGDPNAGPNALSTDYTVAHV